MHLKKSQASAWRVVAAAVLAASCGGMEVEEAGEDLELAFAEAGLASNISMASGTYCGDGQNGHLLGSLYRWDNTAKRYTFVQTCPRGCGVNGPGTHACVAAQTTLEASIVRRARERLGSAPLSAQSGDAARGGKTWLTDVDGRLDAYRGAIKAYSDWPGAWSAGRVTRAVPPPGSTGYVAVNSQLEKFYKVAADRELLIARIATTFSGSVPTTALGVIQQLGLRGQCKETFDRIVQEAGGRSQIYDTYQTSRATQHSDLVPGKGVIWPPSSHIGVVSQVNRSARGSIESIGVIESNWAARFNDPKGDIPWERKVTERVIPISQVTSLGLVFVNVTQ